MLDDLPLIDAHVHPARRTTLKPAWRTWAADFGRYLPLEELYDADGRVVPSHFDAYLQREGVDLALCLVEYSPRVTGIQPIEDVLPILAYNPHRFRLIANLNPHFHYPLVTELDHQVDLGAVALKLHPVHGGFAANEASLYPVYARCEELALPVVFHCGTSIFPGSINRYADPVLVDEVLQDFPDLTVVLAHGGRGWWYDAAAFMALSRPNVWLEISGLPPAKLPEYYARFDFARLARKLIFGTDWPGVPGIRRNAEAVAKLDLSREDLALVLAGNARRVYRGLRAD
ncbi:MAG: amidohydrolase family protein [Nitriliruptorales bacterium]|nr:amidohydrolase family protein [Nitriliruptorales bacterium]